MTQPAGRLDRHEQLVLDHLDELVLKPVDGYGGAGIVIGPHAGAEDRELRDGDLLTIVFGAAKDGYHSDMTRTLIVGGPDAAEDFAMEIYSTVLRAQLAGVAAARPGTPLADVDRACREVIVAAGHGEYFVRSESVV